jgi:hypothetical protein
MRSIRWWFSKRIFGVFGVRLPPGNTYRWRFSGYSGSGAVGLGRRRSSIVRRRFGRFSRCDRAWNGVTGFRRRRSLRVCSGVSGLSRRRREGVRGKWSCSAGGQPGGVRRSIGGRFGARRSDRIGGRYGRGWRRYRGGIGRRVGRLGRGVGHGEEKMRGNSSEEVQIGGVVGRWRRRFGHSPGRLNAGSALKFIQFGSSGSNSRSTFVRHPFVRPIQFSIPLADCERSEIRLGLNFTIAFILAERRRRQCDSGMSCKLESGGTCGTIAQKWGGTGPEPYSSRAFIIVSM